MQARVRPWYPYPDADPTLLTGRNSRRTRTRNTLFRGKAQTPPELWARKLRSWARWEHLQDEHLKHPTRKFSDTLRGFALGTRGAEVPYFNPGRRTFVTVRGPYALCVG
jgi:hypothetical protein